MCVTFVLGDGEPLRKTEKNGDRRGLSYLYETNGQDGTVLYDTVLNGKNTHNQL